MAENVKSIIDEVLRKMRLSKTAPTAVTRQDVLDEINYCMKDLTEKSYIFIKDDAAAITLVTATRSYSLPTDLYDIIRVYDDSGYKVYPVTVEQLEEMNREWVDDSGDPTHFMLGFEGMDKISFYKIPSSDWDTLVFGLQYRFYQAAYADTESTSDTLYRPIGNNRELVVNWCLGKLLLARSEAMDNTLAMSYLNAYYSERKKWEALPKAPEKQRIMGVRGDQPTPAIGPNLPSNYPSLRLW